MRVEGLGSGVQGLGIRVSRVQHLRKKVGIGGIGLRV